MAGQVETVKSRMLQ